MKTESWIQIGVATIILGTLGFLAKKSIDTGERVATVDGKVGSVDTKVSLTSERVDRIANALPDVRVRVADEEVKRPIKTAVLSTRPMKTSSGGWQAVVSVVDADSSTKWSFVVDLANKEDRKALYMIAGSGDELEPNKVSLAELEKFAAIAKTSASVPHYIDAKVSFVLRETDAEEYLKRIQWLAAMAKKSKIEGRPDDWKKLATMLEENPSLFGSTFEDRLTPTPK
jgi:hypothetical protein